MILRAVILGIVLASGGCVAPYPSYRPFVAPGPAASSPDAARSSQPAGLDGADRIARFQRLGSLDGVVPPQIDQLYAPTAYPEAAVPIVRVVFDERVFFDSGSDVPRPEALPVMDVIAETMRGDAPNAQVTVLGHTDAVGGDAYNVVLSQRRALAVLRGLVDRGVDPGHLSTVAIGKRQPVAPNDTPEGRARNRRVEFLISSSLPANLAVVQARPIDVGALNAAREDQAGQAAQPAVQVLRPRRTGSGDLVLERSQLLGLGYGQAIAAPGFPVVETPPAEAYVPAGLGATPAPNRPARRPVLNRPAPVPHFVPNTPEEFQQRDLGPAQPF